MKNNKVTFSFSVFLVGIVCVGACSQIEPDPEVPEEEYLKYGKLYNEERKKHGLPLIPEDWIHNTNTKYWSDEELKADYITRDGFWVLPYAYKAAGRYGQKTLLIKNGELISEIDYFYSGNSFKSEDPDAVHSKQLYPESLRITYTYPTTKNCVGTRACFNPDASDMYPSFEDAKKVLKSWGLKYP